MAKFIPAEEVTSPRKNWSLIQILNDPKTERSCVLALGRWNNGPVLAMRWNGDKDAPIGTPQSRGLPTWFIVGPEYNDALIGTLSPEMKRLVKNFNL